MEFPDDSVVNNDDAWLQVVFGGDAVDKERRTLPVWKGSTHYRELICVIRTDFEDTHKLDVRRMVAVIRSAMALLHATCASQTTEARDAYEHRRNALCPLSASSGIFELPDWVPPATTLNQPDLAAFVRQTLVRHMLQRDELPRLRAVLSQSAAVMPLQERKRALLGEVQQAVNELLVTVTSCRNRWRMAAVFAWATVCAAERMVSLGDNGSSYPSMEQRQDASLALLLPAWWAERTGPEPSEPPEPVATAADQVCVVTYSSMTEAPTVESRPVCATNAVAVNTQYGWLVAPDNALGTDDPSLALSFALDQFAQALQPAHPTRSCGFAEWALLPQWLPPHPLADVSKVFAIGIQPRLWSDAVLHVNSHGTTHWGQTAFCKLSDGLESYTVELFPWASKAVRCLGLACEDITDASVTKALSNHHHRRLSNDLPMVVESVATSAGEWSVMHVDLCLANSLQQVCGALGLLHGSDVDRIDRNMQLRDLVSCTVVLKEEVCRKQWLSRAGMFSRKSKSEANRRARVAETQGDANLVDTMLRRPDGTLLRTPQLRIAVCRLVSACAKATHEATAKKQQPATQRFQQLAVSMALAANDELQSDVLRYL